jgi:hypothetical protein
MQHGPAASSDSNPKAPGSAGGYLLFQPTKAAAATAGPVTLTKPARKHQFFGKFFSSYVLDAP